MEMTKGPQQVVLSGASGMLGRALLRALAAQGTPTVQLVRRRPERQSEGAQDLAGAALVAWNPLADPAIADPSALEGAQAAVHFSGANVAAHRWTSAYRNEMTESRVRTTASLARVLAGLNRRPEVLLTASAIGFYGDRGDELLDEQALAGAGFFPELCRQWEAAAKPAVDAGIRVVHLRIGVVLAAREGALKKMLPLFRLGLGGRLGSGRQWMSWIALEDAVAAILFAMRTPELRGPVNLTAPGPVRNLEFTRTLAKQLNRPAILPAPAFALRLALGQMADEALLASARVFPGKLAAAGFRFRYPALQAALGATLGSRREPE